MNYKQIQQLQKYTDLEGSEIREAINALLFTRRFSKYLSNEFNEAVEEELMAFLKDFETNWEIKTTFEPHRKVVDLVYKG